MTVRINHMELTFEPGSLTKNVRDQIKDFYGDTFGFEVKDVNILKQNALLMNLDEEGSQFILCTESPKFINSPGYDHLGLHYDTRDEVDRILAKVKKFKDSKIQIKEYKDLHQGRATVHAFYVRYLLPIWLDVQVIEFNGVDLPAKGWTFGSKEILKSF